MLLENPQHHADKEDSAYFTQVCKLSTAPLSWLVSLHAICQINNLQEHETTSLSNEETEDGNLEKVNATGRSLWLSVPVLPTRPLVKQVVGLFSSGLPSIVTFLVKRTIISFFSMSSLNEIAGISMYHFNLQRCVWDVRDSIGEKRAEWAWLCSFFSSVTLYCKILAVWWLETCCQATLIIPVCHRREHSWSVGMASWNSLERSVAGPNSIGQRLSLATYSIPGGQQREWYQSHIPG